MSKFILKHFFEVFSVFETFLEKVFTANTLVFTTLYVTPSGNEDDEADLDEEAPPTEGWPVRALYDYSKSEDDELSFKTGTTP